IVRWYTANFDIQDRRQAEDALLRSEAYLEEAQRLSLTGSFGWRTKTREFVWSEETYRIFGYEPALTPTLALLRQGVHPEDVALGEDAIAGAAHHGCPIDLTHRLLMPDGEVKHVKVVLHPTRDRSADWEFVGAVTDITATVRAEEALRRSQAELAHAARVAT